MARPITALIPYHVFTFHQRHGFEKTVRMTITQPSATYSCPLKGVPYPINNSRYQVDAYQPHGKHLQNTAHVAVSFIHWREHPDPPHTTGAKQNNLMEGKRKISCCVWWCGGQSNTPYFYFSRSKIHSAYSTEIYLAALWCVTYLYYCYPFLSFLRCMMFCPIQWAWLCNLLQ